MSRKTDYTTGRAAFARLAGSPLAWWETTDDMGQEVAEGATIEEWRAAAGLAWDAQSVPVQYMHDCQILTASDFHVITRSDTGGILGQCSARYKVHSITEIFETFDQLCRESFGGG